MLSVMDISASALTAERMRMDLVANNIANQDTIREDGTPFQRQVAVFRQGAVKGSMKGVRIDKMVNDPSPPRLVHDPSNERADENGNVAYPNIDPLKEMVNAMVALRAYEANVSAMEISKSMFSSSLKLLV